MHMLAGGNRRSRGSLFAMFDTRDVDSVGKMAKMEGKQILLPSPVLSQLPFARQLLVAQTPDPVEDVFVLA